MNDLRYISSLVLILNLFWAPLASAARLGTVTSEDTPIYSNPNKSSTVLEKLKKGDHVSASNFPFQSFHRVRSHKGTVGWVSESDLSLQVAPSADELKKAGAPPESRHPPAARNSSSKRSIASESGNKHAVLMRLLGDVNFFTAPNVVNNYNNLGPGYSYGGELGYELSQDWSAVLRVESLFNSINLTDTNSGNVYSVNLSSLPVLLGVQWLFGRISDFTFSFSGMAGAAFQTKIQVANLSSSTTTTSTTSAVSSASSTTWSAMGKLNVNWQLTRLFSFFLEGGYRLLQTSQLTPSSGTASVVLQSSFALNLGGPFVGGGACFRF